MNYSRVSKIINFQFLIEFVKKNSNTLIRYEKYAKYAVSPYFKKEKTLIKPRTDICLMHYKLNINFALKFS